MGAAYTVCPDCQYMIAAPPDLPCDPICPKCLYAETQERSERIFTIKVRAVKVIVLCVLAGIVFLIGVGIGHLCHLYCP